MTDAQVGIITVGAGLVLVLVKLIHEWFKSRHPHLAAEEAASERIKKTFSAVFARLNVAKTERAELREEVQKLRDVIRELISRVRDQETATAVDRQLHAAHFELVKKLDEHLDSTCALVKRIDARIDGLNKRSET